MVVDAYTIVEPDAMVISSHHTVLTRLAVMGSSRFKLAALGTQLSRLFHLLNVISVHILNRINV